MKKTIPIAIATIMMTAIATLTGCTKRQQADLIVYNAIVYTVDNDFSQAEAFAVKDGKFVAVGSTEEILKQYHAEEMLDAKGAPVYPGFMDGHCHFNGLGELMVRYVDLVGCKSFDEVIERLQDHAQQYPSEWLLGRGWDQNLWPGKQFPDNKRLNELFPDKYVALTRIDGHMGLVNNRLLEYMHYESPTGLLLDAPYDSVKARIPKLSPAEHKQALLAAQQACFAQGLTGVTDAGLPLDDILLIDSMHQDGTLKIKVNAMMNPDEETMDYFLSKGPMHKERLAVCSIKLYADGALGSRGAYLIEPYSDDPKNRGLRMYPDEYYDSICRKAYKSGFQVCTHAIGDAGVRMMLKAYGAVLKGKNDRRWRIEHSQVVHPDDFELYRKYSIIPSIQSTHATSDMGWAEERLGERVQNAYAYRHLLEQNGWVVNGTDFPIEQISPLYTFYAAVARQDLKGNPVGGWQMENALTREEALRSITCWVAKGYFEEKDKGSIEVGKEADFVVLDRDIMTVPPLEIPLAQVIRLFVSGESVPAK